jgi:hypothetical protein
MATKGESMTLFRDNQQSNTTSSNNTSEVDKGDADTHENDCDEQPEADIAPQKSRFYGWGEFSDSNYSESVTSDAMHHQQQDQNVQDTELFVSFPDADEIDASVTDSVGGTSSNNNNPLQ